MFFSACQIINYLRHRVASEEEYDMDEVCYDSGNQVNLGIYYVDDFYIFYTQPPLQNR
jgi:hypothetical protein